MINLTRNGVAKDLTRSPYIFSEMDGGDRWHFYFSSRLHLIKFVQLRKQNQTMIYNYIYKRFKYKMDCTILADCNLYQKIEKRGFCIKVNRKVYLCPDNIILNGENRMRKNYGEWREILMINSEEL